MFSRGEPRIMDVAIVGGGLSGVFVTSEVAQNSTFTWKLLEASSRLGGRLVNAESTEIDMGGAWIWPKFQPHMRELVARLSVSIFPQRSEEGLATDTMRVEGGAVQFVNKLHEIIEARRINAESRVMLNSPVVACNLLNEHSSNPLIQLVTSDGRVHVFRKVVFAVPPKVLSDSVNFNPPLSAAKRNAMSESRTWMAGVTKVALVYDNRFWDADTSNTSVPSSLSGPAFQLYDSGTKNEKVAALTCFCHIPPDSPAQSSDAILIDQVSDQISAFWKTYLQKPEHASLAKTFTSSHVVRWPSNPFISGSDCAPDRIYPHPTLARALSTPEWDGKLLFAGTETDLTSPGVMEGAIGSAKRVVKLLLGR